MKERVVPSVGFYYDPDHDTNDGKEWTDMDVRDLAAALQSGSSIKQAAEQLCRAGTVEQVRKKAEELGLGSREPR